jgi:hypothetical protein
MIGALLLQTPIWFAVGSARQHFIWKGLIFPTDKNLISKNGNTKRKEARLSPTSRITLPTPPLWDLETKLQIEITQAH